MHEEAHEVVLAVFKAEENAEAHVVDAAFHGAIVRFGVVGVVGLRSLRMKKLVAFLVIGFLEELIGTDLRFVELAVVFDRRRGDVDVQTANGAVLVLDRIDRLDGFEDVFDRVVFLMFARFEKKTLVAEVLQSDDFAFDFFLRELLALDVLVLRVVRAVGAGVDAVVREVERRKENDAGAVDVFLHAHGRVEDLLVDVFQVAGEEHGRFTVREAAEGGRFFQKRIDQGTVVLVFFGVGERVENFFVTDELFGHAGFRIVHGRCLRA